MSEREMTVNSAGQTFEEWFVLVDRVVVAIVGLGADDLSDWYYWDGWSDDMTPTEAAREAISNDETFALMSMISDVLANTEATAKHRRGIASSD